MLKRVTNLLTGALSLVVYALMAGVFLAAVALPAVALTGIAVKAGSDAYVQLPDELTVEQTPQISYVYASDNKTLLATMYDENRRDVTLSQVAPVMRDAILAAEDQKFYEHHGVDVKGIARAFLNNKTEGQAQQGASTLTMQYVRLSISYSADTAQDVIDATEDTNARKLREVKYALELERRLSKDQILEGYLNTAYFGNRAYGVFAAAQVYFGIDPADLTAAQAAFLAALVKFPGDFDASTGDGREQALTRRDYVLDEMVQTGALTTAQVITAKAEPLKVTGRVPPNGCVQATTNSWGFFCDYLQRWWAEQGVFGATGYDRERALKSGGYRIQTTLDIKTQNAMRKNIDKALNNAGWRYKSDALMLAAVEPGSGKVRGLATNRTFKIDDGANPRNGKASNPALARKGARGSYPNTTNPLISGGPEIGGYQPGSVMKIFTLVAALEQGYPLATVINTKSPYVSHTRISGQPSCGGYWCPDNAGGRDWGAQNMWTAFGNSVNTYFVPLFEMTGGEKVIDTARRMGLTFYDNPDTEVDDAYYAARPADWASFTLGASDHAPLQIANAFATLAADGLYCEPIPVESIINHQGEKLAVGEPRCRQNIKADVARAAIDAARCPVGDQSRYGRCGGATARDSRQIVGKPIAGKTGTTDASKSVTLTITTKQLAISGFFTDPDWAQVNHRMSHDVVNPAVQWSLRDAMKGRPAVQFSKPSSSKLVTGNQVNIPAVVCRSVGSAESVLGAAGFEVHVAAGQTDSWCPEGAAAGTSPSGTTISGGVVVIEISNGSLLAASPSPTPGSGSGSPTPQPAASSTGPPREPGGSG